MIELLTLAILLEQKCTIYKIKQCIEKKYGLFLNTSFGSVYPAIKKLELQKCVSVRKSVSQGGQRSSVYSITQSGKDYFMQLMMENLPENPNVSNQLINIRLMLLCNLDKDAKDIVKKSIIDHLEIKRVASKNLISVNQDIFNATQLQLINYNIIRQNEFIEWIKSSY